MHYCPFEAPRTPNAPFLARTRYSKLNVRPMPSSQYEIRVIQTNDDPQVATLIRTVMPEFGASGPGFAIHDAEVDEMFRSYSQPRSIYFVISRDNRNLGGGGIAPLEGGDTDTCELRKMYFLPEIRGLGLGRTLIQRCLESAKASGFRQCYLETLESMTQAQRLYEKSGFHKLDAPMGATGHFGCDRWYLKQL